MLSPSTLDIPNSLLIKVFGSHLIIPQKWYMSTSRERESFYGNVDRIRSFKWPLVSPDVNPSMRTVGIFEKKYCFSRKYTKSLEYLLALTKDCSKISVELVNQTTDSLSTTVGAASTITG